MKDLKIGEWPNRCFICTRLCESTIRCIDKSLRFDKFFGKSLRFDKFFLVYIERCPECYAKWLKER